MKVRSAVYAPVLFGVVLILVGFSARLVTLMGQIGSDPFLSVAMIQLLVFLLPLAFYCVARGMNFAGALKIRTFSLNKLPFLVMMTLLLFAVILFFRYLGLFWFKGAMVETPSAIYVDVPAASGTLKLLCDVLMPALLEEILFRGILLEEYLPYGKGFAVMMAAMMFAMVHLSAGNLIYYLAVGAILGAVTVVSDSLVPAVLMHVLVNLSYFYLRPSAAEYVRQTGKSPLLPYLLFALILLLLVLSFSRLEDLFRSASYDEMLQSRKELLRREMNKNKPEEEPRRRNFFLTFREVFLSPTFLAVTAVYVLFAAKIL